MTRRPRSGPTGTLPAEDHELTFRPTPRLRRLALVAGVSLAAAIALARGELVILATAPLVLLAVSPRSALPRRAGIRAALEPVRCVEGDELTLSLDVEVARASRVDAALALPGTADARLGEVSRNRERTSARWTIVPNRWGRYRTGPLTLRVLALHGLYSATVEIPLAEITVYPAGGTVSAAVAPRELPARLGEHASRAIGSGVEFAGVRPYSPGDRRRDIDWRTSARQNELFVRNYAAERSFSVVLVLDVGVDAGEPGRSTLDLTVRAASGLAHTYLSSHDRVGVVALGGSLRWLSPAA